MKKLLFWQLPWAGPSVLEGEAPVWSVMPSPGLGDAQAVCLPVKLHEGQVVLALADPRIEAVAAPLGKWTVVDGHSGADHTGFLCMLGYDQSRRGLHKTFVCALPDATISVEDLQQALIDLQHQHGDWLLRQILDPPPSRQRRPVAASRNGPVQTATLTSKPIPLAAAPAVVSLAFASCQYPSGLMDGLPAQASLERLADLLDRPGELPPERLLLLGDQIYSDATAGLLDPVRLDDRYRVPYEELLHMAPLRRIMARIPVMCMLDDHEIVDNWAPVRRGPDAPFIAAVKAYWTYQRGTEPRSRTWMRRAGNGWSLFVADTRSRRDLRCEDTLASAEILGAKQREDLEGWLSQLPQDDLKLVASPSMLLPRLVEHLEDPLHVDGWQGYPASLERLLQFVCDQRIENLCFLSGDAHLGCDVDVVVTGPRGNRVKIRSIHTPALYAPLPFANAQPWNLKIPDHFHFPGPAGPYRCDVTGTVTLPRRDGCCLLQGVRGTMGWRVSAEVL